jgi:hypothetical protein
MATQPQSIGQLTNQVGLNIDALTQQLGQATQQIEGLMSNNTSLGQQQLEAIGAQAAASTQAKVMQTELRLKHQALAGLDPNQLENEYAKSLSALNLAQSTYDSNRQTYDKITSTNMLEDPLGFIFGQLQLPSVAAKLNNSVAAISAATGNITARQELLQKQNSVVVADTIEQDRKALGAQATKEMTDAAIKLNELKRGDLTTIASLKMQQISALNTNLDNRVKAKQLEIQAAEAAGNRALRARQIGEMDELKALRVKELKDKMEAQADYTTKLSAFGKTMGFANELTPKLFNELSPQVQNAISTTMLNGRFGSDLPEALKTLTVLPGAGVITDANPGLGKLMKDLSQYTIQATAALGKPKVGEVAPPVKDRPIIALSQLQSEIEASTSVPNSPYGSASSRWDSNPNPTLIDPRLMQSVSLPNNSLAKAFNTVLSLKGPDAPLSKKEEQKAYRIVRDMVINKQLTPDQAVADIVQYTKAGIFKSRDFYKYDKIGIETPKSYYSEWEPVGAFGKSIPLDMTSPGSIKQALIKDIRGFQAFDAAIGSPFTVR